MTEKREALARLDDIVSLANAIIVKAQIAQANIQHAIAEEEPEGERK